MKNVFTIIGDENRKEKCEVFCSFDSNMTGKSYVVYTDNTEDEEGRLVLMAGSYEKVDEEILKVDNNLSPEEFEMVSSVMNGFINKVKDTKETQ